MAGIRIWVLGWTPTRRVSAGLVDLSFDRSVFRQATLGKCALLHDALPIYTTEEFDMFARFIRDDQGQDLIEYLLLGSFVSIGALLGATLLGTELNGWYSDMGS